MAKQVCDIQPTKGMSKGQSNEHLRIATSTTKWNHSANFDPTREKLNFEIGKGGALTEVDKQKSIQRRIKDNLKARGLEDPNEGKIDPYHNTVANIILQGSRTRMRKLAFGDQEVNWDHGSDNSHITRCPEIEQWAQDMYKFMSRKYGEENIAAFIVHLDESNPHIHCTLLPIVPWEGRNREHFSYRQLFGGTKPEKTAKLTHLHDELAEVNKKWGLERGDPIALTGAQHKSTYRWLMEENAKMNNELAEKQQVSDELDTTISDQRSESRHLNKNIKKAQKRLKGLTTMYENLLQKKEALEQQMKVLEQQLEKGAIDLKTYQDRKESLQKECDEVIDKLTARRQQIAEAKESLDQYLLKQINTEEEVEKLERKAKTLREDVTQGDYRARFNALDQTLVHFYPQLVECLETLKECDKSSRSLTEEARKVIIQIMPPDELPSAKLRAATALMNYAGIVSNSIKSEVYGIFADEGCADLRRNMFTLIDDMGELSTAANRVALCLCTGCMEGVAAISQTCGGGGQSDTSLPRRQDDERFFDWWERCKAHARKMLRPSTPKQSQGQKGGFHR